MGFSKKTAKGRLDKYYFLAKDQGYRARSAFKLVQLNKKYNFLEKARVLIDLCAAPGGWLQVAAKLMPVSHLIIGVDLCPIKAIPNVITMVNDITTEKCRSDLRKELKTWKADVVLNDGAPNVGKAWIQDAYSQAELALSALKLATDFLVEGGTFVTKVFRSKDYNSLLFVLNQLFERVEATKPASSRNVSAEIFVVCRGYRAPSSIDPRLLDPRSVFEDVDVAASGCGGGAKTNVLHPERKKRHRDGYEDHATILYKTATASEFVHGEDPVGLLSSVNAITFVSDEDRSFQKYGDQDVWTCCQDLKVIGRKEFKLLLKWRSRIKEATKDCDEVKVEVEEETPIDPLEELEGLEKKLQRQKKREKRRALERKAKQRMRLQLQMENSADLANDIHEEGLFTIKSVKSKEAVLSNEAQANLTEEEEEIDHSSSSSSEESSEEQSRWDLELEVQYQRFKLEKNEKEALRFRKETKADAEASEAEEEEDSDEDISTEDNSVLKAKAELWYSNPIFKSISKADDDLKEGEEDVQKKLKKERKNTKNAKNAEESSEIVFVKAPVFGNEEDEEDVDEETRQILLTSQGMNYATKLCKDRKKSKQDLIDQSFNRFAFGDDRKSLPSWFLEDENRHNRPEEPLTKEAALALKLKLDQLEAAPNRKEQEAKSRNKRRAMKRLEGLRKKAAVIAESEDISGGKKTEQIEKLLRKANKSQRRKTRLVVAKGGTRGVKGRPKGVRGHYKMVDSRLRKDLRGRGKKKQQKRR